MVLHFVMKEKLPIGVFQDSDIQVQADIIAVKRENINAYL